jgi:RNA polymerase sigma-70 factor, ECF subfamily
MNFTTNDKELILSIKSGSELAFSTLFYRYHQKLFFFSLKVLKSNDLSEEIVQNTFIRIWTTKERIDEELNFESYLFKIAKNLIIDHLRKAATERAHINQVGASQQTYANDTEDIVNYNELKEISNEIVETMPDQQRTIFKMSREQGLSHDEIAQKMGISINTVKVHVYNSLKYIRKGILNKSYN